MTELAKVLWFITLVILFSNEFTIWWFIICAIAGVIAGIMKPEWFENSKL